MKEKIDALGPKTVFTIKHSDIPKGITQCAKHVWRKKNEMELDCVNCPTCIIVNPETLNEIYGK